MKKRERKKPQFPWFGICVALLLAAGVLLWRIAALSAGLDAQNAAARWQGDSETAFAQVSCFVPVDEPVTQSQIYSFRTAMLDQLHTAALDADGSDGLWVDAWSAIGKLTVSSSRATGEASVMAVGGDFFTIHPLRLLSGSYIREDDLMKDRVLLDEELAWLLYGGIELQGMSVYVNGVPFVIAGVIEREQDDASRLAYTAGQGLYMSYDAYVSLTGTENITCYELVLAEPVDGFAKSLAQTKFPIGRGEVLQNTGRFRYGRLLSLLRTSGSRSMQAVGLSYPYWENAARVVEDRCMRLLLLAILLSLLPTVMALIWLIRLFKRGWTWLSERLWPKVRDNAEEAVRVRQRRHWEKKHGLHEK